MKKNKSIKSQFYFFLFSLLVITGCSQFNGLRTPLYDGKKIEPHEEAIEIYHTSREIVGMEQDYYFRYPFSVDIYHPSLDYTNEDAVLLEEGSYVVGEDLPAGRVTFQGNHSVFNSENYEVHVGNLTIRDQEDEVYFENLFHSEYGQLVAQVDLISGHEITIIGTDSEITAFYAPSLPSDPYQLMDPPELLVNLDRLEVNQPIQIEDEQVTLTAGIYEVGTHLEAGTYEISNVYAVHNTEMYLFREGDDPRVFELLVALQANFEEDDFVESEDLFEKEHVQINLQENDKIYPNLVHTLTLTKIQEE